MELVLLRCSEDAHNSGCSGSADQHGHYSSLGLGHLAPPGRPQAAPAFLTGAPQCYRVPQVQLLINVNLGIYSKSIVFHLYTGTVSIFALKRLNLHLETIHCFIR